MRPRRGPDIPTSSGIDEGNPWLQMLVLMSRVITLRIETAKFFMNPPKRRQQTFQLKEREGIRKSANMANGIGEDA